MADGTVVKSTARYVRVSPRKARVVCNAIRKKRVDEARTLLQFIPKRAAKPVLKLLDSAIDVAVSRNMNPDGLYVKDVYVDKGPTLKRWLPRARGIATPIHKHMSHITVVLEERFSEE